MARTTRTGSVVDNSLLVLCLFASLVALFLPTQTRDRSAATLRRSVAAPLALLQRRAELSRAAFLSYDDRMESLGELTTVRTDNAGLRSENARLRKLLGLASRLGWGFVAGEASPAQLETDLVEKQILQTFNVSVGERAGVQAFAPVISADGLVGMVETVDAGASIGISYSHPDFRASVTTPNDSAFGIVQAHLASSGAERGLLEMRGVAFRSPLKAGQLIVSSGLGGTYPRGIPIGTVIREIVTAEKWARTYLLEPSAPLADIGPVFVLLKRRADEGVATVWMSPQAADSAARGVAAAGDSLARDAALRESAARRAAFDSLADSTAVADSTAPRPAPPGVPAAVPPAAAPTTPTPGAGAPAAGAPAAGTPPATVRPTVPAPRPATGGAPARTTPAAADSAARRAPAAAPRAPAAQPAPQPATQPATPRPTVPRPTVPRPTVPVPSGTDDAGRVAQVARP